MTVATAAILTLTGCAAGGSAPIPAVADTMLHPTGEPGNWFHDEYAGGTDRVYATSNQVCAVGDGVIVEEEEGPGFTRRVTAKVLFGGGVVWTIEGAGCSEGRSFEGSVVVGRDFYGDRSWELIDIATGDTVAPLPFGEDATNVRPLARVDSVLVFDLDFGTLAGVTVNTGADGNTGAPWAESAEAWSLPEQNRVDFTALADGYIGILDSSGGQATIVDGRTGETVMQREVERPDWFTWASDGFIDQGNQSDPEYVFYDISGAEIDRTVGESQYSFVPRTRTGVTFALADHLAAGTVVGVDSKGRPALMEGGDRRNFSQTSELPELPDSSIMLQGVSADGSLLMFEDSQNERIVVIDNTGAEVFDWTAAHHGAAYVDSGKIVVVSEGATTVLLPAGHPSI